MFPPWPGKLRGTSQAPCLLLKGRSWGAALNQGAPVDSEKEDHHEFHALWWALGRSIFLWEAP